MCVDSEPPTQLMAAFKPRPRQETLKIHTLASATLEAAPTADVDPVTQRRPRRPAALAVPWPAMPAHALRRIEPEIRILWAISLAVTAILVAVVTALIVS